MSYDLRDHTADVAVEATGGDLSSLFGAVAEGLTEATCDADPGTGQRFPISTRSESREAALFDYLDQLIYERDVREVLPVDHRVEVRRYTDDWTVEATARGVPLSDVAAREVKAVTYSDMVVEEREDGWYAYVVFDV